MDKIEYSDESDMYSEDSSTNSSSAVDRFLSDHLETTLDLFSELQDRFGRSNAFFLGKLKSTRFVDFIIDIVIAQDTEKYFEDNHFVLSQNELRQYQKFVNECLSELNASYGLVGGFLRRFKIKLHREFWGVFCFKYSYHE